eukprot:403348170
METSMSASTHTRRHRGNSNNRVNTDSSPQLNNSQLTNNSNFTSTTNGMREPPKAYEEIIQKLENDIRTHIRVEQQMKIAMETLQQKLEDKDKEKLKIKNEYKVYIHELKQDKKRYIELLELRDLEMASLHEKVKKIDSMEDDYKSKLQRLEVELEDFKTRERDTPMAQCQDSLSVHNVSRSLDRPSIKCTSRASIMLNTQQPQMLQSSASQSFLKKQSCQNQINQALLNISDFGRKNSHSNNQSSLGRKSPDRVSQNLTLNLSSKVKKQTTQNSNNTSQTKMASIDLLQNRAETNIKKQSFLTSGNSQLQKMIASASQNELANIGHRKSNSSSMSSTQNLTSLKGLTQLKNKKSQERLSQQQQVQNQKKQTNYQQKQGPTLATSLSESLAHTQSIQAIKKNIQQKPISMNLLSVNSKIQQNTNNYVENQQQKYLNNEQSSDNLIFNHDESFEETVVHVTPQTISIPKPHKD